MKILILTFLFSLSVQAQMNPLEQWEQERFNSFSTKANSFEKMKLSPEEGSGGATVVDVAQPTESQSGSKSGQQAGMPPGLEEMLGGGAGMPAAIPQARGAKSLVKETKDSMENPLAAPSNMAPEDQEAYNKAMKNIQDRHSGQKLSNEYVNDVFGELEGLQKRQKK